MPINQRQRELRDGVAARIHRSHPVTPLDSIAPRLNRLLLVLLAVCACPTGLWAQPGDPASSPQARADVLRAIPFNELNEASREKLRPVLEKPSLYRRMPTQAVDCDPDLHLFLIRYPEVIVNIWQLMDVTKVQVKRTGAYTFDASDGAGTVSQVELVYGRPDLHIFYATGHYEGPLFRTRIEGDCVLVLRSVYAQRNGRGQVSNALDAFVRMDKVGADILLKTLHPLMGKTADYNFVETAKFMGQVSLAAENNGPGVERLAARLTNVDASVRESFAQHAVVAYQRAVLRQNAQTASPALDLQSRLVPNNADPPAGLRR